MGEIVLAIKNCSLVLKNKEDRVLFLMPDQRVFSGVAFTTETERQLTGSGNNFNRCLVHT